MTRSAWTPKKEPVIGVQLTTLSKRALRLNLLLLAESTMSGAYVIILRARLVDHLRKANMEVKGATYLYTLAGLMITFAGFSALLFGLRQAAGARLSLLDRYLAKTIITYIFVLTGGALLPSILGLYGVHETWIWRASGVLFAIPMFSLQITYPLRRRKVTGNGPPPAIFWVFVVLGSTATLAMLVYILTGLKHAAAAYITALTIDFFTVAFGFVTALDIIMHQPMEMSVGEASAELAPTQGSDSSGRELVKAGSSALSESTLEP